MKAEPLGTARAELGECPVWDAASGHLNWIDILRQRWLVTDPATGTTREHALPLRPGCIVQRQRGGWILAGGHQVFTVAEDAAVSPLAALPAGSAGRFNDGKCDAAGRLWVGTATAGPGAECALWCVAPGTPPQPVVHGITMSNGLGWSPDARIFYHVDSAARQLRAYSADPESGALSAPRPLFSVAPPILPDGLAVDADGHIWLALWGAGAVVRLAPDGHETGRIEVPTPRVSSCAFGGPGLRQLFITTACEGATEAERGADPLMGALFVADTGVAGLPVGCFAG